jgi:hypothetical protein
VNEALNPTEGIRLLLERQEVDPDAQCARYQATIYTVSSSFHYAAELSMDGAATLRADGEAASEEDLDTLSKLAKSTARAAKRKQAEKLPPWPPRVLRWRGPGRG